jgi:hypothetical protein
MKYGFWQIQIKKKKITTKQTFTIPFGQYEWNLLPFVLRKFSSKASKNNE